MPQFSDEQINAAIAQAKGNKTLAAKLLGATYAQLISLIKNNPELSAKHIKPQKNKAQPSPPLPSPGAMEIHRPALPAELEEEDGEAQSAEEIAAALAREDELVKQGVESMGLSTTIAETAKQLQRFQRQHFVKALDMLGGGMVKAFLELMAEVEKINKKLAAEGLDLGQQMMLRQDRAQLYELMNKIYDRAKRASLMQAMVEAKAKEPADTKPKGFLKITARKGSQVAVKMGD